LWWHLPVIPALGRLRQEELEFEASLDYTARSCLKKLKTKNKKVGWNERSYITGTCP
jgi:hypothetical protein